MLGEEIVKNVSPLAPILPIVRWHHERLDGSGYPNGLRADRLTVPMRVLACETLTGADLKAVNTFAEPRRVAPQRLDPPAAGSRW